MYKKLLKITGLLLVMLSCAFLASCKSNKNVAQQNFYNIFSNVNNNTSTTASTSEIDPGATNKFVTPIPATPTPKVVNPGDGTLTFSLDSGFYSTNQTLTISSKGDFPIYYTVNGDSPSVVQKPYNGNILLSCSGSTENVVVIRAAAFNGNKMLGNVITKTYILSASIDSRYSMPVISLVTDGGNLYNSQVGILAPNNISKKGRDWERPVNVTFFEPDGTVGFSQDAGIRLQGSASRNLVQKSFRLVARKEYDEENGKFKYEIFPGHRQIGSNKDIITSYDKIILRDGANDSLFGPYSERATMIRDELAQRIAASSGLPYQDFRPAVVYLNGQYYGILNIREDFCQEYIQSQYDIPSEDVVIITNTYDRLGDGSIHFYYKVDDGTDEDVSGGLYLNDYSKMQSFIINNNMADNNLYNQASSMLDMENFYKYMAFEMYVCNTDWPHNNIEVWKTFGQTDSNVQCQDGKWRYMFKDLDFAFARYSDKSAAPELYSRHDTNMFDYVFNDPYNDQLKISAMFKSLLNNDSFRINFVNYMCDLLNGVLSPQNAEAQMNLIKSQLQPEMLNDVNYWKTVQGQDIWSNLTQWDTAFETISNFFDNRPVAMLSNMKSTTQLKLTSYNKMTLQIEGSGTVIVNTVNVSDPSWTGTYFDNLPVVITAVPDSGYRFGGFIGTDGVKVSNVSSTSTNFIMTGDGTIKAVFTKN